MERTTSLNRAKEIMGNNFFGPVEIKVIEKQMGIYVSDEILKEPPAIQYDEDLLEKIKNEYILILGIPYYKDKTPLTIFKMREHFGVNPELSEPCFYNQDWYIREYFSTKITFNLGWNLVKKRVFEEYRGISASEIKNTKEIILPKAVFLTYLFFAWYLYKNEILWENDYLWCNDYDINGDQIYVGKYLDPNGVNKNGFEVHRHLRIKTNHSLTSLF